MVPCRRRAPNIPIRSIVQPGVRDGRGSWAHNLLTTAKKSNYTRRVASPPFDRRLARIVRKSITLESTMLGPYRRLALFVVAVSGLSATELLSQEAVSRPLAPGVLTVIPPDPQPEETFTGPTAIAGIVQGMPDLKWTPHYAPVSETVYDRAQNVVLRRPIWCLEFAFKPVRMIDVDVPQPSGKMQRKSIWYLVYNVRNNSFRPDAPAADTAASTVEGILRSTGSGLKPTGQPDRWGQMVFTVEPENFKTWFMPHFVLRCHEYDKEYLDRIIPAAQRAIAERERVGVKLHNSVEISQTPIPLSDERTDHSVWGVAMWEDVDPRIDFFSIYVGGLTNAFRLPETASGSPASDERRTLVKTLQLNFWRPGDTVFEHEREFRYGVPYDEDPQLQRELLARYGLEQRLDHVWVYR